LEAVTIIFVLVICFLILHVLKTTQISLANLKISLANLKTFFC